MRLMINSATPATMTTTLARLGITVGSFSATENLNGPDIAFMRFLQGPSRYRSNRWTSAAGENRHQAGVNDNGYYARAVHRSPIRRWLAPRLPTSTPPEDASPDVPVARSPASRWTQLATLKRFWGPIAPNCRLLCCPKLLPRLVERLPNSREGRCSEVTPGRAAASVTTNSGDHEIANLPLR